MRRAACGIVLWLLAYSQAWGLDLSRYHSQDEINDYLRSLAVALPELVHFRQLGYSDGGREVNLVILGRDPGQGQPAIYLNGTHHGNEKSSTETTLAVLSYLVANRQQADISRLLDSYAIYVHPLVNPDGHAADSRYDSRGRDPNRDYDFATRPEGAAFKTSATKLVKELTDRVRFRAAVAYHSGMEAVLWPLCYTPARPADNDTFYTLAKTAATAMGVERYVQSFDDYPTGGEFIDYVYLNHGTLALTFEVSHEPAPPPPALRRSVEKAVAGTLAFLLSIADLDQGRLNIERQPRPVAQLSVPRGSRLSVAPTGAN